ncbi:hypothetical protein Tco_0559181 [Tanacetum coccineum]
MSADSAVTYTSVHSEARSWSIPSEDPYEEAARQLLEQAPRSPEYVPDPMELEVQVVAVFIPELSIRWNLVPAEDEAPTPLLPPSFLSPPDIPEADTPPRKRLLLTTPRPGCEVGESSAAAAARQPGPTMAHRVDYSLVDTMETRFRDTERRMMTALEMVNRRVTYQVDVCTRESSEFCTRHHDAQKDRAAVRAEIEILRRERLAYEQESMETRQALARSEDHCRTLEARVTLLETEVRRHEWQRQAADDLAVQHIRQAADDLAVQHIMRTQALEAGARVDTLEDTASRRYRSFVLEYAAAMVKQKQARALGMATIAMGVRSRRLRLIDVESLKVKGTDVVAYSRQFQQLALMCSRMFPEEIDKIEKYIGGLPDIILGSVKASKSKTMQEVIEFTTELMEEKTHAYAERQGQKEKNSENEDFPRTI